MSGLKTIFDYLRDSTGAGVNAAAFTIQRLADNASLASGSTATDAVPATALAGAFSVDETTLGYPGPVIATVTDPTTNAVRVHTSKAIGIVGAWRTIDVTRMWRMVGTGVVPGVNSELAVSSNGSNMVLTIATGEYVCAINDHSLIFAAPASLSVTVGAADAANPRIDTVALRFYPPGVAQEGRVDLVLLPGTPSSSPAAPGLTQNAATYWETPLADVRVDATVTSIAVGKVTDRRSFCFLYPAGVATGDLFYVDANGKLARLAKGTSGQYLKQGASLPAWTGVANTDVSGLGTMSTQNASAVAITGGTVAGITDLAVADGGTGASDAATARAHLGLNIGVDVQAYDPDLANWATKTAPSGVAVGTTDTQTLSNKTLDNSTVATLKDANWTLQDDLDATKQAKWQLSGLTTATTRTYALPDASTTLVGTDATQTLTSKTLTTPTIADFTNAGHGHFDAPSGGQHYVNSEYSQDTADNQNTTNQSTPAVACTTTLALPAGTWTVRVAFDGRATHATGGTVNLKINVGGTASGASWTGGTTSLGHAGTCDSAKPTFVNASVRIASVAGNQTINIFGGYYSSASQTANMTMPRLIIDAIRTA